MSWPQPLHTVNGPFAEARVAGAADGMGTHGPATQALIADGLLSPDLLCGMTLFLLARQKAQDPSPPAGHDATDSAATTPTDDSEAEHKKASPIDGGVWVREQFTIHRPLAIDDRFVIDGASTGRFVRKGRRYGVTTSRSQDSAGRLVATNLTCGLLSYRAEAGADAVEGQTLDNTPAPGPDAPASGPNPHLDQLSAAAKGDEFGGSPMVLSLAMMAARDTSNPDNPIHSDLDAARAAGLAAPIAGGSHVLSFALEPLLAAWGSQSLLYGTHFDVMWKAPTEAEATIVPSATVTESDDRRLRVAVQVTLADSGTTALTGTLTVPRRP